MKTSNKENQNETNLRPTPEVITNFFKSLKCGNNFKTSGMKGIYTLVLNYADKPIFENLKGIVCVSRFEINFYNGTLADHWFEIKSISDKKFITNDDLKECGLDKPEFIFLSKYHGRIVKLVREYLNGGWLLRYKNQENYKKLKQIKLNLSKYNYAVTLEKIKNMALEEN